MKSAVLFLMAGLALAGCALPPPPSTARLPPGAFGSNADNDIMAINTASWAFSDPARTHGNLINATRAVLAIEYLAGELWTNPRWDYMSPLTKQFMLQARQEVRAALGIAPDAPSQLVANALLALTASPTPATAAQVIRPPVFTLSPDETIMRLENLPYLPIANKAAHRAAGQEFPGNDINCVVCG